MSARPLSPQDLREVVRDPSELKKGIEVFERGGLAHLARYESRLFAEAAGAAASPYKVGITFHEDGSVKARCACMAARTRPFCKHGAGLLVAWARAPESFAVAESAPAEIATGAAKRKTVKQGKVDARALLGAGVAQAATLVRELAVAGMALAGSGRADQMRELALALRENRLRRLSARTLELATLVEKMGRGAISPIAATDLVADMLLTVRKLEKHLGGEALEPRHEEELVGRTWRRNDRTPITDLALVEYSFSAHTTADKFVVRESRFVDLRSGVHYSEKQILPAFLAKRAEPKPSFLGKVLAVSNASAYPGYAPIRLDLENVAGESPLDGTALQQLLGVSLATVGDALTAYQDARRDVFAPERLPIAVSVDTLLADGTRLLAVDAADHALYLRDDKALSEQLSSLLRGASLRAILGEVAVESALPTMVPRALVVSSDSGLELRAVATSPLAAAQTQGARAVRSAGASAAAVSLAEIREELASGFVAGLAGVDVPLTRPLVLRLAELGLTKPAQLLEAIASRPDPESRLDDFVKLYQVLEIALVRLLAATPVERAALIPVPTFASVQVRRPEAMLPPREVAREVAEGRMSRFESAVHLAHHYERMPADELARAVFPIWADGSAQPFVVRAMKERGEDAVTAATHALAGNAGRVARLTAIQVLGEVGGERAEELLWRTIDAPGDPALSRAAAATLNAVARRRGGPSAPLRTGRRPIPPRVDAPQRDANEHLLGSASQKDDRARAALELGKHGDDRSIPLLRTALVGDNSTAVRGAAARALARLLDLGSVDIFIRLLGDRAGDDAGAKAAAYALGDLGDARGLEALLEAWAAGWKPGIVGKALKLMGRVALDRLIDFIEIRPELAARKAALAVLAVNSPDDLTAALLPRVVAGRVAQAGQCLKLATVHDATQVAIARRILEVVDGKGGKSAKAVRRAAEKALT